MWTPFQQYMIGKILPLTKQKEKIKEKAKQNKINLGFLQFILELYNLGTKRTKSIFYSQDKTILYKSVNALKVVPMIAGIGIMFFSVRVCLLGGVWALAAYCHPLSFKIADRSIKKVILC